VENMGIDHLINDAAMSYVQGMQGGGLGGMGGGGFQPVTSPQALTPAQLEQAILNASGQNQKRKVEAKTLLNQVVQKLIRKPISKDDIVYTIIPLPEGFQATVQINAVGGEAFAGPVTRDPKLAEKAAAEQALDFFRSDPRTATIVDQCVQQAEATNAKAPTMQSIMPQMPSNSLTSNGTLPDGVPHAPIDPVKLGKDLEGVGWKQAIHIVLGKVCRTVLQKDAAVYDTRWDWEGNGYKTTVRISCLPAGWAWQNTAWCGETCPKKKDAEISAAGAALGAILDDQRAYQVFTTPRQVSAWKMGGKGSVSFQQSQLSSAAVKANLGLSLDGQTSVGSVQISPATTMASVRAMANQMRIRGLPDEYLFIHEGCPLPKEAEAQLVARDFMPMVLVADEDLKGARRARRATASAIEDQKPAKRKPEPLAIGDIGGSSRARDSKRSRSRRKERRSRSRRR